MKQSPKDLSAFFATPDQLGGITPEQAHRNGVGLRALWQRMLDEDPALDLVDTINGEGRD